MSRIHYIFIILNIAGILIFSHLSNLKGPTSGWTFKAMVLIIFIAMVGILYLLSGFF